MVKNLSKIYQQTALMILVVIISGLFNICLFAFQAKAASIQSPELNFAYDNSGNCVAEPISKPTQTINRPATPMPECCLAQNRYYNAVVSTAKDQSAGTFAGLTFSQSDISSFENHSSQYNARLAYPPPMAMALASTVIRE